MADVSIVIPVAGYHSDIAQRAINSASAQTISAAVIVVNDQHGGGASWARNRGLEQVATDFVVFLDADDWIAPTFVERTLAAWQTGRYVYSDWWQGETPKFAPACPFVNKTWHVVTTLLRTEDVRQHGGFDETLTIGGEDSDFYLKLNTSGVCGLHLPELLFHYSEGGQRGSRFVNSPQFQATMREFTRRYGGKMGCCGDDTPTPDVPVNEPQPGDVLARAIWNGNRVEVGRATRRHYPRTGNGKQVFVNPRDVEASPHLWQRVSEAPIPMSYPNLPAQANIRTITPSPVGVFPESEPPTILYGAAGVASAMLAQQTRPIVWQPSAPVVPQTVTPVDVRPDVTKVSALYAAAVGE